MSEYLHIGVTLLLAGIAAYSAYILTKMQVEVGKVNTKIAEVTGAIKEWSRNTFAEKAAEERIRQLEMRGHSR